MSEHAAPARVRQTAASQPGSKHELRLQRKCACGKHTADGAECHACKAKRTSLQRWPADRSSPAALLRGAEQPERTAARDDDVLRGRDFVRVRAAGPTAGEMGWLTSALAAAVAGNGAATRSGGWPSPGAGPARLRDTYPAGSRVGAPTTESIARELAEPAHPNQPSPETIDVPPSATTGAAEPLPAESAVGTAAPAASPAAATMSAATPGASAPPAASPARTAEANEERPEFEEQEVEDAAALPQHRLLFDDGREEPRPGQMSRGEFLARLRVELTRAAEEELAGTGQTTDGCPYLRFWFAYYARRGSREIERSLRRWAPEAARARTAADAIPPVAERVRRAVATWAETGEVTGVPAGLLAHVQRATRRTRRRTAARAGRVFGPVQLKAREGGPRAAEDPEAVRAELGEGRPLDGGVRSRMEAAFGRGLGAVHLHTGATATRLAGELNARAFTVGSHVAFGAGEYRPGTPMGDALIAHELAHVVQQRGGGAAAAPLETGSARYGALEGDADRSAAGVVASLWGGAKDAAGKAARNALPALRSGLRLSRCPARQAAGPGPAGPVSRGAACVTVNSLTATITGRPTMTTEWSGGHCEFAFGKPGASGARVESVVDVPPGCRGKLEYVQLVDTCRQLRIDDRDFRRKSSGYILDKQDPWRSVDVESSGEFTFHADDSPGQPVVDRLSFVAADDRFKTYLLWRPEGESARVPLAVVEWFWRGKTTRTGTSGGCASDWQISDTASGGGTGVATTQTPTWSATTEQLNRSAEPGTCDAPASAPAAP